MYQPTTKLHYKPMCKTITIHNNDNNNDSNNEYAYHLIVIRANKYIQKFWKQTIAGDASLCYMIITLFYITLTLEIMLINVTYLDISVSNILITPRHGLFCVWPQPIRACVTIQRKLCLAGRIHKVIPARLPHAPYYSITFVCFSHIKPVQIIQSQI